MRYNNFDTHKHIKALIAQGLKESQAEAIIATVIEGKESDLAKYATKEQFVFLKNEIELIKKEIDYIKANMVTKSEFEIFKGEIRAELKTFKGEIKTEIAVLRSEIASVKFDILKWIMPIMLTNTVAILGLIISILLKK